MNDKSFLGFFKLICMAAFASVWAFVPTYAQKTHGIGTDKPNPRAVLELNVEQPGSYPQGFLLPRLTTAQRTALASALTATDKGMMVFDTNDNTVYTWDGTAWMMNTGNNYWLKSGANQIYTTSLVGIGTANPHGLLQFPNTDNNRKIVLHEDADNDFQFYGLGIGTGHMRYTVGSTAGDHRFFAATSPTTATELMRIRGDGTVGIGTATPNERLTVQGNSSVTGVGYFGSIVGNNLAGAAGSIVTVDGAGQLGLGILPAATNYFTISGTNIRTLNNTDNIQLASTAGAYMIGTNTGLRMNNSNSLYLGNSGNVSSSGNGNFFAGSQSGASNTTGFTNVFIGFEAGKSNTTGSANIFLGEESGLFNTTGKQNIFVGLGSGTNNTAGDNNVFLGANAGLNADTGNDNIFIGQNAGTSLVSGSSNIAIGNESNISNGVDNSVALGNGTFVQGNNSIAIGYQSNANGPNRIVLGANITGLGINTNTPTAMLDVNGGARIRALSVSGSVLTVDGLGNVGMGTLSTGISGSGVANQIPFFTTTTNVNSNSAFTFNSVNSILGIANYSFFTKNGSNAYLLAGNGYQFSNFLGTDNVYIGSNIAEGYGASTGSYNVVLGYQAGYGIGAGSSNVFLGRAAGNQNFAGNNNIFIGENAGFENSGGANNIIMGRNAGYNTLGSGNIMIGQNAGISGVNVSNNVIIGNGADVGSAGLSDVIAIGAGVVPTTSKSAVIGSNITALGINTNNPTAMLDVNGGARIRALSVSGSVLTVDGLGNVGMGSLNIPQSQWISASANQIYTNSLVGIGIANPQYDLHVQSSKNIASGFGVGAGFIHNITASGAVSAVGNFVNHNITSNAGNPKFVGNFLQYTGEVTVGTELVTGYLLEYDVNGVRPVVGYKAVMSNPGNGDRTGLDLQVTGGGTGVNTGIKVEVGNAATNYAAIFNGGNVGVNSLTPTALLDVNGNARIAGPLTLSGLAGAAAGLGINANGEVVTVAGAGNEWYNYNSNAIATQKGVGIGNLPNGVPIGSNIDFAVIKTVNGTNVSMISINNSQSTNLEIGRGRTPVTDFFSEVKDGDVLANIRFIGAHSPTDISSGAEIQAIADQDFSASTRATRLIFGVARSNQTTISELLRLDPSGAVGIGAPTLYTGNEALRINSAGGTRGMVVPYINDAQKTALTPTLNMPDQGMLFWNTDAKDVEIWDGTNWQVKGGGNDNWTFGGNTLTGISYLTVSGYGKIGSNDNFSVAMVVNNQPYLYIGTSGGINIGSAIPFNTGSLRVTSVNNQIDVNNKNYVEISPGYVNGDLGNFGSALNVQPGGLVGNATFSGLAVDVSSVSTAINGMKNAAIFMGGNVGVGINTPSTDLQVNGELGLGDGLLNGNKPIVIWLRNIGSAANNGDIVIVGSSDDSFSTTDIASSTAAVGVLVQDCPVNSICRVAVAGVATVRVGSFGATRGQHCVTSTTTGRAASVPTPGSGASIGVYLTDGPSNGTARVLLR